MSSIYRLIAAVQCAITDYDGSGDHTRHDGGAADDCIRCKLVAALPPGAQNEIDALERARNVLTCPHCAAEYRREPGQSGIRLCRKCERPVDANPAPVSRPVADMVSTARAASDETMVQAYVTIRGGGHFICYLVPEICLLQVEMIARSCQPISVCLDEPENEDGERPCGWTMVARWTPEMS